MAYKLVLRFALGLGLGVGFALGGSAESQEPPRETDDAKATAKAARAAADAALKPYRLEVHDGADWREAARVVEPLMLLSDPTRLNEAGSMWAWGERGRPAAVCEIYRNQNDASTWILVLCNTSGQRLRGDRDGQAWWSEHASDSKPFDLPGVEAPAGDSAARQRQIRALVRRFAAHELWNNAGPESEAPDERYDLRLVAKPLRTYQDDSAGVSDGALFAFANGTNPELLLFLEATVDGAGKPSRWRFAVGRLAHAALRLEFDEKPIWSAEKGWKLAAADKPYFLLTVPGEKAAAE